jgi:hypothetical protein
MDPVEGRDAGAGVSEIGHGWDSWGMGGVMGFWAGSLISGIHKDSRRIQGNGEPVIWQWVMASRALTRKQSPGKAMECLPSHPPSPSWIPPRALQPGQGSPRARICPATRAMGGGARILPRIAQDSGLPWPLPGWQLASHHRLRSPGWPGSPRSRRTDTSAAVACPACPGSPVWSSWASWTPPPC